MSETAEIRAWAKSQGIDVPDKGRLPASVRRQWEAAALPGPGDPLDDEDLGDAELDDWPEDGLPARANTGTRGRREASQSDPGPVDGQPADGEFSLPDDEPPARLQAVPSGGRGKRRGRAPSAAVKADVRAKIALMVEVPAQAWRIRDQVCGTVAVQQAPEITDAFLDIVMGSPDMIEFFSGAGGEFMKYMKLIMAGWPVAQAVIAHHVGRREQPIDPTQPAYDPHAYAA